MGISAQELSIGQSIGSRSIPVCRQDLIRYAGASGDLNPIHWNERFAREVDLPGVIAHGMLTMGAVVSLVTDWAGDPAAVVGYQTRFTKPVPVRDTDGAPGAVIDVAGVIGAIDTEKSTARVDLTVTTEGQKVLVKAQVIVRLA
ncbi:MaoC family dehydratase [Paenarthrobacter sp. Z7-10]|uniref:MaoC family dehydratase n=1 Tax=Paenarthrobacter sp. Z7-10 TaxID=2787635 RepID=UPI0022A8FED0|nr:MaoC family dehydratase [Paenarthrobacter sp. Z7-10]MCZ2402137.1 MaoC family dehydratase [Paenarthrobacter sp. Z7-10]